MSRTQETTSLWLPNPDDPAIRRLVDRLPQQSFWSTCKAMVHHHTPAPPRNDVNGYYEALGVSPDCTRKELRDAYMRLVVWDIDEKEKHAYRTQAFKTLYNEESRAEYDALDEDEWWVDPWVEAEIRRRIAEQERRSMARAARQGRSMWDEIPDAVDDRRGTLDEELGTVDIGDQVPLESFQPREMGLSPLERWQTELLRAFARRDALTQVAVSYCERAAQVGVVPHRHGLVFLIGPEHLSAETPEARQAAEGIIEEMIS